MNRFKFQRYAASTGHVLALAFFFVLLMFPFFFILITSFKPETEILKTPIKYIPNPATVENYINAWNDSKFALYFFNTVLLSVLTLLLVSVVSMMTGYAMSRYQFRGKSAAMVIFLITQIVPGALLLIPLFTILQAMGLINSIFSVVLATSATLLAYSAWIDGCTRFQAVMRVLFPLLLPGLVATGAYAFVNAWNSFLLPLILLTDPDKFTLTLGLKSLIGQYTISYGRLSAAGIICLIPAIAMFAYIQKYMVAGLSAGAVKG